MPEGPEVRCISESLHRQLAGKLLLEIECLGRKQLNQPWSVPQRVKRIFCRGKKIFWQLESGYLYVHLNMTGSWSYRELCRDTSKVNSPTDQPSVSGTTDREATNVAQHVRYRLHFGQLFQTEKVDYHLVEEYAYFNDPRTWGKLLYLNAEQFQLEWNSIGPDLLNEEVSYETWCQRMSKSKRQLVQVMLDQKVLAGIGNYLKSEILYRAAIRPDRCYHQLDEVERERLYQYSCKTIREAYRWRGVSIRDYVTPEGKRGEFALQVYQRQQTEQDETVLKQVFADGRSTFWVPTRQC